MEFYNIPDSNLMLTDVYTWDLLIACTWRNFFVLNSWCTQINVFNLIKYVISYLVKKNYKKIHINIRLNGSTIRKTKNQQQHFRSNDLGPTKDKHRSATIFYKARESDIFRNVKYKFKNSHSFYRLYGQWTHRLIKVYTEVSAHARALICTYAQRLAVNVNCMCA